jgi:16S rRNA (cytidine1402-2'-O)-methyltransferase
MISTMSDTKRQILPQILPPGLWIVATPIGNLADLSPRCRSALEEADWILCEDTRRTLNLLRALGLPSEGRLKRLDAHTEAEVSSYWIDKLREGAKIALVSDAGTPVVSDPGAGLVAQASSAGIRVTPLPGPSAVMTLLAASGFQETAFTFRGFFPRKNVEQVKEIDQAFHSSQHVSPIWIWFESPKRIEEALQVLATHYPDVPTAAGKELTKVFERIFYGTSTSVSEQVRGELLREGTVGEWCFSVCFPVVKVEKKSESREPEEVLVDDNTDWVKAVKCLLTAGISASETARIVSQQFGISKKICYRLVILHSQYKKTSQGG